MRRIRNDRALFALLIGFVTLAVLVLGTIWLSERQDRSARLARHTLQVEARLSTVLSRLQAAESGQRGFILTGRPAFLVPYEQALNQLDADITELDRAVSDNPAQHARVARLRAAVAARTTLLRENLTKIDAGTLPSSLGDAFEAGRVSMSEVGLVVAEMKAEEARLLRTRLEGAERQGDQLRVALIIAGVAVLLLGAFAFLNGRRRLVEAVQAADSLADANARLGPGSREPRGRRGPGPPGPEDAGRGPAHRGHRARLQQHAGDRHRLARPRQAPAAPRPAQGRGLHRQRA
jgi:CHASE3 domain sensor protein